MKNKYLLISICIVLVYNNGCDSNTSKSEENNNSLILTGILHPVNSIAGGIITMRETNSNHTFVFAESSVDSIGQFRLIVPQPPEYLFMSKIYDHKSAFGINERYYSDSTGRYFAYSYYYTQRNDTLTYASIWGDSLGNGNYNKFVELIYSTKNVLFTGKDSMFLPSISTVIHYNLNLSIGWNKVIHNYLRQENNANYYEYYVDNSIKGHWFHQRISAYNP